jgi:hypothetical protein
MNKIVYLFGAGASCNVLPLSHDIPDRLSLLIERLKHPELELESEKFNHGGKWDDLKFKTQREFQLDMIKDLEWLLYETINNNNKSPDQFARKIFLNGANDKELKKLKIALSIFFICEQANRILDHRYDSFFSKIIHNDRSLPKEIKILTWNYDYQLELAYSNYILSGKNYFINEIQSALNVITKFNSDNWKNEFAIFKLNGSAGFYKLQKPGIFFKESFLKELNIEFVYDLVESYVFASYSGNFMSSIDFAWEIEIRGHIVDYLPKVINTIKETEIFCSERRAFPIGIGTPTLFFVARGGLEPPTS